MTRPPLVLTIAGSDPTSGAGVQSDLRTLSALGVRCVSVVTAVTVQSSHGVQSVHPVSPEIVAAQLATLLADERPDAVKIGMLGGAGQVRVVAETLRGAGLVNVVLDPILASSNGVPLLDDAGRLLLISELGPLCALVTPNQDEWRALPGVNAFPVLIKGGHLDGDPTDVLRTSSGETRFFAPRIDTPHTHGTGCLLSTAIAGYLARGLPLQDAVQAAKDLLTRALQAPTLLGTGRGYPNALAAAGWNPAPDTLTHGRRLARLQGVYVVTDPLMSPSRSAEDITKSALAGGAKIVQLRDKTRSTPDLISLAKRLVTLTRAANALLLVNDRVDIALASDADGVHLGPDDMSARDARRLLGPDRLIGISASGPDEARDSAPFASYVGVGAVYGTATKADAGPAIGVPRLAEMRRVYPALPIIAIGGIALHNIAEVAATGVAGAAVVSAVLLADDMTRAVQDLTERFARGASGAV